MKKLLLIPASFLLLSLLSCKNDNSDEVYLNNTDFRISFDNSYNAVITGYNGNSSDITIPSKVISNNKTYNVIKIEEDAFKDKTFIENVKIPSSIISIGKNAFYNTKIYNNQIDNNEIIIDDWLIKSDSIKSKIRGIAAEALSSFSGELEINESDIILDSESDLFSISDCAFQSSNITSFSGNVKFNYIGKYAFEGSKLETFNVNYLSYVSDYCFANSNLSSVSLPENVFLIGKYAFYNTKLESIELNEKVTNVSSWAFANISTLKQIVFNANKVSFGENIFYSDSILEDITLPKEQDKITANMFSECSSLKNIELPSTISTINTGAFYKCKSLEEAKIPDGVKKLTQLTFASCTNLRYVFVPTSVEVISARTFEKSTNMRLLYLGSANDFDSYMSFEDSLSSSDIYFYDGTEKENQSWHYDEAGNIVLM